MESSSSKKFMAFQSIVNAATTSLSQKQSSPDFYKEVNVRNNIYNNISTQYISSDVWGLLSPSWVIPTGSASPASQGLPARRNSIKALKGSSSSTVPRQAQQFLPTINQAEKTKWNPRAALILYWLKFILCFQIKATVNLLPCRSHWEGTKGRKCWSCFSNQGKLPSDRREEQKGCGKVLSDGRSQRPWGKMGLSQPPWGQTLFVVTAPSGICSPAF